MILSEQSQSNNDVSMIRPTEFDALDDSKFDIKIERLASPFHRMNSKYSASVL